MYQQDVAYRIFTTDSLYILNNNITQLCGGSVISGRFYDLTHPQPEETRTSEEIIEGLKNKLKEI